MPLQRRRAVQQADHQIAQAVQAVAGQCVTAGNDIETVRGQRVLTLPLTCITGQQRRQTRIQPAPSRRSQNPRQGSNIQETQVQALPGQRVHGMGGVGQQHHPVVVIAVRQLACEREHRPGAEQLDRPQPTIHGGGQGLLELCHRRIAPMPGLIVRLAPDNRAVARTRCQGQEGQGPVGQKALPAGSLVRLPATDVGDQSGLAIVMAAHTQASQGAQRRSGAIGGHGQRHRQLLAIGQLQGHGVISRVKRLHPRLPMAPDRRGRSDGAGQRVLQHAVLDDASQLRPAQAGGIELQAARGILLPDVHAPIRGDPLRLRWRPCLQLRQQRQRGR